MSTHQHNFNERFEFTGKTKTYSLVAIVVGIIALVLGLVLGGEHIQRVFSNLLLMSYYFTVVCVGGVFFLSYQYASQSGWSASILRIPQVLAKMTPAASIIFLIVATAGLVIKHPVTMEGKTVMAPYLYASWATPGLTDPNSGIFDAVIAGKSGFLNIPFFYGMNILLLGAYSFLGLRLVKFSNEEDTKGGMLNYNKSFTTAVVFLVIFGFTFPLFAFAAIISLEAHWYSTMFGWYNLAGLHVSSVAAFTLILLYLSKKGYMSWFNENHLHDLGKIMFGFSIFWTYLWFGQFFLTWYANIPDESVYFYKRWEPEYKFWFWLNIVLNFCGPLFLLMSRDAKRLRTRMTLTCIVLLVGHWLDWYIMIMPGTVEQHRGFGIEEFGIMAGFVGLFIYMFFAQLSKVESLVPKASVS